MTDQPDEADLAADQVAVEPGLVVEDDVEFDLGESEDVPSVGAREEAEAEPEADETTEIAAAVDDEPEPEADVAQGPEVDEPEPDTAIVDGAEPIPAWAAGIPLGDEPPPPGDEGGEKASHWGRRAVLGLVAVVAALYVLGYFLSGTRMPADASIGPVD
ncbi:MAG: hypothetical protein JWR83_1289, partial [Aeromicrobium sp.]|nr:hypothetical protein [Aeromicrobium sp.]